MKYIYIYIYILFPSGAGVLRGRARGGGGGPAGPPQRVYYIILAYFYDATVLCYSTVLYCSIV